MNPSAEVNVIELHTVTSQEDDGEEGLGDSQEVPELALHDELHHDQGNYIVQGDFSDYYIPLL